MDEDRDDRSEATGQQDEVAVAEVAALREEIALARNELANARRQLQDVRERDTMLQGELQHGIRNMLAVVRSIFSRSVAGGGSLSEVADHFRGRLDVLARYQLSRTHRPGGTADFETMLLDELQTAQASDDPRVALAGPVVAVPFEAAQLVGLAIHELVTNSIKFGVLSSSAEQARLTIGWSLSGDALDISWREEGVAILAPAPFRKGFGRGFIEEALPYQLGASTRFDLAPGQLSCTLSIPLRRR
jgi:two-component sensor histidine kinase